MQASFFMHKLELENNCERIYGVMQKNCKCGKIINYKDKECGECAAKGRGDYYRAYDEGRDNSFYKTKAWTMTRDLIRSRDNGLCILCLDNSMITSGDTVHHIDPLEDNLSRGYDSTNLITVCRSCHSYIHSQYDYDKDKKNEMMNRLYAMINNH